MPSPGVFLDAFGLQSGTSIAGATIASTYAGHNRVAGGYSYNIVVSLRANYNGVNATAVLQGLRQLTGGTRTITYHGKTYTCYVEDFRLTSVSDDTIIFNAQGTANYA